MRIHIIGNSGSGKSSLAEQLCTLTSLTHYDLDDVYWDNTADHYGTKHTAQELDALLTMILRRDDWIIEGIYDAWITDCLKQADEILLLKTSLMTCKRRVIHRFIKRKLGILHDKKESLSSLCTLLSWMNQYYEINLPRIQKGLKQYATKVTILRNQAEIDDYLNTFKAKTGS